MEVDGYASDCCVLWPLNLINMSHVQVHTWPNFWWKYLRRYCIHPFFGQWPWSLPLIPKAHRRTQIHLWPKLGEIPFIRLWYMAFTRFSVIAWCDLDIWPFDLMSMSYALIHTSPNFGVISWNIYENIVFIRFSGHCHLWPWHLTFWP